jgi:hypothetical protein
VVQNFNRKSEKGQLKDLGVDGDDEIVLKEIKVQQYELDSSGSG